MGLKGTRLVTMEDGQKIPKEAFHRCFQQWSKCVRAQGSYFEGD
jgi:hypothetical protein